MKKVKLNKKELKSVTFALLGVACLTGCSGAVEETKENHIDFWSVSASEKIYQDQPAEVYEGIRGEAKIEIDAFKGDHEGKQLIMTPSENVKYFDADVTDLTSSDGSIISKDKVSIYAEKYVTISQIYDTVSQAPIGKCPDALVPVKNSKEYNDSKIEAGKNQGLYISVNVPHDQKPGVYTGTITVDVDGAKTDVPMSVNVIDVTINKEIHTRSVFLDHWQFWNGEMDSSEAMYDKYHYALADYYVSPNYAIIESELKHDEAGINRYVEKTYELMQYPRMTTICIPYAVNNYRGEVSFDEEIMKEYIRAFFKKSVDTGFNMIKRLAVYFGGIIDEPYEFGLLSRANVVNQRYKVCLSEIADELALVSTDSPIHDELVNDIRKIRQPVTTQWHAETDGIIDTYAPKANFYDTPEMRANYDFQEEKWWYTCVEPHMPYPTYHTEDTLSSARSMGWMQSNWDIVGNLFWSVNVYAQLVNGVYMPIDNYYTGRADRYSGCNGDGYLFYPGAQYGYDGPLPSMRIEAIRDGNEEYEVLYNIKEKAKSLGLDDKAVFNLLTNSLYEGAKVIGTSDLFEKAKLTAGEIDMAMRNGSDFVVSACDIDKSLNRVSMEFYAKSGSTIKVNGTQLDEGSSFGEGHKFIFSDKLDKENNDYVIEVSCGGKSNTINAHLSGTVTKYGPNELKDSFAKYNSSVTTSIETIDDTQMLKLAIGSAKDAKQSIKFNAPFIQDTVTGLKDITVNIYNPGDEDMIFSIGGRNELNNYDNYYVENTVLKPGLNSISLSTIYFRLKDTPTIKYFFMVFGNSSSKNESAKEVYIRDVTLMRK